MNKSKKYLLKVWGTLKKGRINHWMLNGFEMQDACNGYEYYTVSKTRLFYIDIFEFLCGYKRIIGEDGIFIYRRF